jgi:hypothetical protein
MYSILSHADISLAFPVIGILRGNIDDKHGSNISDQLIMADIRYHTSAFTKVAARYGFSAYRRSHN